MKQHSKSIQLLGVFFALSFALIGCNKEWVVKEGYDFGKAPPAGAERIAIEVKSSGAHSFAVQRSGSATPDLYKIDKGLFGESATKSEMLITKSSLESKYKLVHASGGAVWDVKGSISEKSFGVFANWAFKGSYDLFEGDTKTGTITLADTAGYKVDIRGAQFRVRTEIVNDYPRYLKFFDGEETAGVGGLLGGKGSSLYYEFYIAPKYASETDSLVRLFMILVETSDIMGRF